MGNGPTTQLNDTHRHCRPGRPWVSKPRETSMTPIPTGSRRDGAVGRDKGVVVESDSRHMSVHTYFLFLLWALINVPRAVKYAAVEQVPQYESENHCGEVGHRRNTYDKKKRPMRA